MNVSKPSMVALPTITLLARPEGLTTGSSAGVKPDSLGIRE